jgi:hypothetical protein
MRGSCSSTTANCGKGNQSGQLACSASGWCWFIAVTVFVLLSPAAACGQDQAQNGQVGQLLEKFGDVLGFNDMNDEATSRVFRDVLSRQLGSLEKRRIGLVFSDGPNPANAIAASRPIEGRDEVLVALDKSRIVSQYTNLAERREMVWFALLHELQNAARAATFRRLNRKGLAGLMNEDDWVRAQLSTEVNAIRSAYAVYVAEVYPKLHLLGAEPRGTIQAGYGEYMKLEKDRMLEHYLSTEIGEYYRQTYRSLRGSAPPGKAPVEKPAGS